MSEHYKYLFSPVRVGSVVIKNRIAMMPMGVFSPRLMGRDGAYTKDGAEYYIERAKGGAGLIITGLIPVVENPVFHILADPKSFTNNIQYLFDGVHHYGSKIFIQLSALSGRANHIKALPSPAPAPIRNVWDPRIIHRGMSVDEIKQYVKNFAEGAYLVQQAGGDGVEIHAVHEGYLLDQFAIANTNLRTDEYGGSLENRLRFPVEIIQAIKARCGKDFPVSMRYSVRSYMKDFNRGALPGEDFNEFGRDLDESRIVAGMLQDAGYDMLNADNGSYDSWYWSHPPMYMPKACNLYDVSEIKKVVNIPVICAGRFDDPELADLAIAEKHIDMLGLGRPLLADPEIPKKYASGRLDEIRPCIACHQGCLGQIFQMKDISCAVNPACGREVSYELKKATEQKKVLVVGGGIGGMEAARVCAIRGHSVSLYEKNGELGGVFIAASVPGFKDDDRRLLRWYKKQMKDLDISLSMDKEATKSLIESGGFDEIFVATGAHERKLDVPGLSGCNVSYALDTLRNINVGGDNVVIIGGGLTGCELAYIYGVNGKKVTLIEKADTILNVFGLSAANYNMLMELLDFYKVNIIKNAEVEKFENGVVTVVETVRNTPNTADRARHMFALGADGVPQRHSIPADHIVVSVGYTSDDELFREIKADNIHLIGDAKSPSNVMEAVWSAYAAAMAV